MNQTQRKFLIDKVNSRFNSDIDLLKKSLPDRPNLEAHILHEIMSDRVEIVSNDEIENLLKDRVLSFKKSDRLFGDSRSQWDFKQTICFKAEDFFVTPEKYKQSIKKYKEDSFEINEKISSLSQQQEMLVLRIQLASPKKLEKLISEVDDFGDLSLFDTKLKQLK